MNLHGVAAVVTGGASGLGEAAARALASEGAKVAIFDFNAERGDAVARDIGGVYCKVDITSDAEVDAAFTHVGTASVAAEDGQIGQAAYSASKAGVVGMTLPIARDLMDEGIRVNTIMPGTFDTPLLHLLPPEVQAGLASAVPFPKRAGRPDEFASLALEMCRNSYFNGAVVRLDGAIRMPPR